MNRNYDASKHQRFKNAIETLVGAGRIQDRLESATLQMIPILPEHLPLKVEADYDAWLEALLRREGDEVGFAAYDVLSDEEAERLAKELLGIYTKLVTLYVPK